MSALAEKEPPTTCQSLYWDTVFQTIVNVHYCRFLMHRYDIYERCYRGFLTFSSSSSVGAWYFWEKFPQVWASIVIISQIAHLLWNQLPWEKHKRALTALTFDLSDIADDAKRGIHKVWNGDLTDDEINDLAHDISERASKAEKTRFPDSTIPDAKNLVLAAKDKAADEMKKYL